MPGGPFDRIFADIRKDLPSVPDAVVRQEIFRVMDDFTQRTNIWQESLPFTLQPDVRTYNLPIPTEGKINRLILAYAVDQSAAYWGAPGISMRVPGVVVLMRAPTVTANWMAIVAKRTYEPLNSDKYPDIDPWIVEKNADTIGRGILARLQLEPQKPYSNPMLAAANQRAYISGCSLARVNDAHANVLDGQNWMYPQGWSTVQRKPWT
jgi:hypothetical protein